MRARCSPQIECWETGCWGRWWSHQPLEYSGSALRGQRSVVYLYVLKILTYAIFMLRKDGSTGSWCAVKMNWLCPCHCRLLSSVLTHHQLLDLLPLHVISCLVRYGDCDPPLDALMKQEGSVAGHAPSVVHHWRDVAKDKQNGIFINDSHEWP